MNNYNTNAYRSDKETKRLKMVKFTKKIDMSSALQARLGLGTWSQLFLCEIT